MGHLDPKTCNPSVVTGGSGGYTGGNNLKGVTCLTVGDSSGEIKLL
jgi:hypothetical protein